MIPVFMSPEHPLKRFQKGFCGVAVEKSVVFCVGGDRLFSDHICRTIYLSRQIIRGSYYLFWKDKDREP